MEMLQRMAATAVALLVLGTMVSAHPAVVALASGSYTGEVVATSGETSGHVESIRVDTDGDGEPDVELDVPEPGDTWDDLVNRWKDNGLTVEFETEDFTITSWRET